MFLVIFAIFLVIALLRFCQALMEFNHLTIQVFIASILSIVMCIGTILLQVKLSDLFLMHRINLDFQVVIILSSFKLSALAEMNQRAVSE